jgi:thymidine kinase
MNKSSPYLELIIGPMFSGKTSRLVELYNQYKFCNMRVSVINHSSDNRYDDELMSTHDKIKIPCIKTNNLTDIWRTHYTEDLSERDSIINYVNESDVILINEGQFFKDLYDIVVEMLEYNKRVYVCGLDGDFERKKIGNILDLIPLCDKVTKLTSLCSLCKNGTLGIFSMRLSDEKEQIVIGSDNYIPVCRNCYETNYSKKNQIIYE